MPVLYTSTRTHASSTIWGHRTDGDNSEHCRNSLGTVRVRVRRTPEAVLDGVQVQYLWLCEMEYYRPKTIVCPQSPLPPTPNQKKKKKKKKKKKFEHIQAPIHDQTQAYSLSDDYSFELHSLSLNVAGQYVVTLLSTTYDR